MLAVLPILTRAFQPSQLGLYQIALSVALVAQPFATTRIEYVLPVQKSPLSVTRLVRRATMMSLGTCLLLTLSGAVFWLIGRQAGATTAVMTATLLAVYAWTAVDNALLVRARDYRRLATRNLLGGLTSGGMQLVVALWVPNVAALALAMFAGRGFALLLTRRSTSSLLALGDGVDTNEYTARRAVTTVALGTVSTTVLQALTLVTASTLGQAAAGLVGTTQRVAGAPASFVSQGLAQLVQGRFSPVFTGGSQTAFHRTLLRTLIPLTALAGVIALGLAVGGPLLVEPVLGPEWGAAGPLLAIVAVPTALQMMMGALNPLFVMAGGESTLLVQQLIRLVLSVGGAAGAAILTRDLTAVVATFAVATTAAYVANILLLARLARRYDAARTSDLST
ncbi:lipopolysaccharide biosynthesis protein [Nocardioides sp. MAHUQ-72]|uniref:lipopolysaccharide biosynthesis protein n=1 Tax=unclassified Nocardioides TaxID=2615069 RepID=UPI00361F74E1